MTPDQGVPPPVTETELDVLRGGLEIIAARSLGSLADVRDVAQETLVRAIQAEREGRIPAGVSFAAFAHGIQRHVVADVHRGRARESRSRAHLDWLGRRAPSPLDCLIQAEERAAVGRALSMLSASDRALLEACFVRGERSVEIARQENEPPERVRKRKSRALERLRRILTDLNLGPGHEAGGPATSR